MRGLCYRGSVLATHAHHHHTKAVAPSRVTAKLGRNGARDAAPDCLARPPSLVMSQLKIKDFKIVATPPYSTLSINEKPTILSTMS